MAAIEGSTIAHFHLMSMRAILRESLLPLRQPDGIMYQSSNARTPLADQCRQAKHDDRECCRLGNRRRHAYQSAATWWQRQRRPRMARRCPNAGRRVENGQIFWPVNGRAQATRIIEIHDQREECAGKFVVRSEEPQHHAFHWRVSHIVRIGYSRRDSERGVSGQPHG